MTTPNIPNIPLQLAGRPTAGGFMVPWITARTPDGRYRFGAVDLDRQNRALTDGLCQICGAQLGARIVFAMRDSDLRLLVSPEPGMHPVCAAYSATACPMLAGRMGHYRTTSLAGQLADLGVLPQGDPASLRAGAPAEPWQLVWVTGYRPFTNPLTDQLAALLLPEQILRVRPIGTTSSPNAGTEAAPE
ncbi:hypothetical protein [Micromonospora sp. NPDC000018]|uniref:hypothetical protein n=1 Tax=Micromonospora sp. NPDC000018 TaxID=3154239 RepID=UPI00332DEE1F